MQEQEARAKEARAKEARAKEARAKEARAVPKSPGFPGNALLAIGEEQSIVTAEMIEARRLEARKARERAFVERGKPFEEARKNAPPFMSTDGVSMNDDDFEQVFRYQYPHRSNATDITMKRYPITAARLGRSIADSTEPLVAAQKERDKEPMWRAAYDDLNAKSPKTKERFRSKDFVAYGVKVFSAHTFGSS